MPPVLGCWRLGHRKLRLAGHTAPEQVAAQLEQLVDAGFQFLTLEAYRRRSLGAGLSSAPRVLLTFDHPTAAAFELLWPILMRLKIAPVLFVTTGAVGRRRRPLLPFGSGADESLTWAELLDLRGGGASIQCHGHTGAYLPQLPPEVAFGDLMRSRREVERRLGTAPIALSYPSGAATPAIADLAAKAGFELGFTRTRRVHLEPGVASAGLRSLCIPRFRLQGRGRDRVAERLAGGASKGSRRAAEGDGPLDREE